MLCIIEGSDKAGKSTLAKHLSEVFNLECTHLTKPKTDDSFNEYSDMIDNIKGPMIYDRSFLSEYVYANLWRGGCKITNDQFRALENKIVLKAHELKLQVFVIYAFAPLEIIKERCIKEKEDLLQLDQVEKCQKLYSEIMSKTMLMKINYNSSTQLPKHISQLIGQLSQ
jgi:thymidylate kinase